MLETFCQSIPNGVHIATFIGMILCGLVLLLPLHIYNKSFFIYIFLFIFFVVTSRVFIKIESSRYTAILIYPATITTAFFCIILKKKLTKISFLADKTIILQRLLIIAISIVYILNIFMSNPYNDHFRNSYKVINEIRKENKNVEVWSRKDLERIKYYTGIDGERIETQNIATLAQEILDEKPANQILLIDLQEPTTGPLLPIDYINSFEDSHIELIFSAYTNSAKNKKHNVYQYKYKNSQANAISNFSSNVNDDNNILDDGGVELVKSIVRLDLSQDIRNFVQGDAEMVLLPQIGHFLVSKDADEKKTWFSSTNSKSLNGMNISVSAAIDPVYFLFNQKFSSGKYYYSAEVSGTKGSKIQLIYDRVYKFNWSVQNVASFNLPDQRCYRLSGYFNCDNADDLDYFLVGVTIKKGEAILDNFHLQKVE